MDFETMRLILDSNEHLWVEHECDEWIWYGMDSSLTITIYDEWNDVRLTFNMPSGWELWSIVLHKKDPNWNLEIPLDKHFGVPCIGKFRIDQIDEIEIVDSSGN